MDMAITAWLGIDIAKQKFDVALNWNTRRRAKVFRNDAEGWQALLRWLKDLGVDQVHACLEATGRYGDGLALHLHDAGHRVSVVNPAQIKHFGRAKLGRNKTDRADAALICDYCRLFEPAAWTPPSAALRQLRDLVRTREALSASRVEWTNRRGSGQESAAADAAMARVIARLEAEIAALDQAIEDAIGRDEDLRARHDLLISVPGIATHTAAVILSELPGCWHGAGSGGLCRSQSEPSAVRLFARCAVADLPDRQRHPARRPLLPGSRCAPLEPAGGRPAPALEGPGPAQAQADRRSCDAQTAAPVLRRAQDRQTVRSRSRHANDEIAATT
jgi:transposase